MPEPKKGEPLNQFIGRFVQSNREKRSFPDLKQRLAVGYSESRKAKK